MPSTTSSPIAVVGRGKLGAADFLLLFTLTPVWIVCLVLDSIMVFGDGPSTRLLVVVIMHLVMAV